MPLDAGIYQNALSRPRSAQEYTNDYLQTAGAAQNLLAARAQAMERQRALEDQNTIRNAISGLGAAATDEQRINALKATGLPSAFTQADTLQKALIEREKTQAAAEKDRIETKQKKYGVVRDLIQGSHLAYQDALKQTNDPAQALELANRAYQGGVQQLRGLGLFDDADVQRAGTFDPQVAAGFLDRDKELQARDRDRGFQLKAANDVMKPDGKGGFVPNEPYIAAKRSVAKAGAPSISINTEKSLLTTMGEKLGGQLDASLAGAKSAVNAIGTASRLRDAIDSGKIVAGPGANVRLTGLQIGQMLGVGGKDAAEQLTNTRQAMQAMAQLELDAAQQMRGQGQITEAERDIIRRAAAGDINMTAGELKLLANSVDKVARTRIRAHQAQVKNLGNLPNASVLMPFYTVEEPPAPKAAAAPGKSVVRTGTLNGRKVVQYSDGTVSYAD